MYRWSILETGHSVCLEVVSIFPPFVLVKKHCKKAKKLFKVSFLSLSKDLLVNWFWENLSFCQLILVFNCDLRLNFQTLTKILFLGKVTIQFLHQLRSH